MLRKIRDGFKDNWDIVLAPVIFGALAWSCAAPTSPDKNPNINIYAGNNNGNGGGSSPSTTQCVNPDEVNIDVPGTIEHGTPVNIDAVPSVSNQIQTSQVCPAHWKAQAPCFIGNPGALQTSLNASAQDLSGCAVQVVIGTTSSAVAIVQVN